MSTGKCAQSRLELNIVTSATINMLHRRIWGVAPEYSEHEVMSHIVVPHRLTMQK